MPATDRARLASVLTLGWAVIIAVLTLTPADLSPPATSGIDKLYHAVAFALLVAPAALLWRRRLIPVALAAIAFGGAIELIQPSVGRHAEWGDLAANVLGVGFSYITGRVIARRSTRHT